MYLVQFSADTGLALTTGYTNYKFEEAISQQSLAYSSKIAKLFR